MSRARKAKRAANKPAPQRVLSARDASTLRVIEDRLRRCCDLMTCLDHCQDAELNLGALALCARDLIDRVIDDLAPFRRSIGKSVRP